MAILRSIMWRMLCAGLLLFLAACEAPSPGVSSLVAPEPHAAASAPAATPIAAAPTVTPTPKPSPTPTVTPPPTATPLPTPMVEVMSASGDAAVRLRSGPGNQHEVVGALQPGQFGELAEMTEDGAWVKIDTGDLQGWLPANWIVLTGEISFDLPGPTQRTRDGLVQAWDNVNVRAGPGRQFRILGRLVPGQIRPVIGKSADGLWWQIVFQQRAGWVSAEVVQFAGDGEIVQVTGGEPPPTETPAPESALTPSVTATQIEETIGAPAP